MAYTRANAETALVTRASKKMALVGFAVTIIGSNTDLNDPIGMGLLWMGKSISNISTVTDADLAALLQAEVPEFLDRAELRLLENILGNYDLVNISLGPRSESLNQIADNLRDAIKDKREQVKAIFGGQSLEAGTILLDTQTKMDDV